MRKRFTVFNDADYLSKLSPEERVYYEQFVAEYYYGRRPADRSKSMLNNDQMRQRWNSQYKERRDMFSRRSQFELRPSVQPVSDPLQDLVELLDLKREVIKISIVSVNHTGDAIGQRARREVPGTEECSSGQRRPAGCLIRMPRPHAS